MLCLMTISQLLACIVSHFGCLSTVSAVRVHKVSIFCFMTTLRVRFLSSLYLPGFSTFVVFNSIFNFKRFCILVTFLQ